MWFQAIKISSLPSTDMSYLIWISGWNIGVDVWLQICRVKSCHWVNVMVRGLFCQLAHSFISFNATMASWYPAEADMCAFIAQYPEEIHDIANDRVLSIFTLNRLQAGHWIRIDYYIMAYWLHVPIIVQCQSDGCSLNSKDGTVIWESFRQLVASCLTILEMADDDHRSPNFANIGLVQHQESVSAPTPLQVCIQLDEIKGILAWDL